jgi:Protein of unknown function DUF262
MIRGGGADRPRSRADDHRGRSLEALPAAKVRLGHILHISLQISAVSVHICFESVCNCLRGKGRVVNQEQLINSFHAAQSRLVVQTADLPLGTLADMVENDAIDLQPGFQRRERWKVDKQSALIESFLLNVPVPPIYLAEESNGTYTAIDGKQRLKAINDYLKGRYSLRSLEKLTEANGLLFDDLPPEITNALRLRPFLRVVTLLKQTDPLLKYEVFLRLNRAGEPLNNQEIRNVAFRGILNTAIYGASRNPFLRAQLKIRDDTSSAYRDMVDAEYVLRFLTLNENLSAYNGDLSASMDTFMRAHQSATEHDVGGYIRLFETSIERCQALWGDHAFHRPEGQGWRDQMLAGLYDAQMVSAARLSNAKFHALAGRETEVVQLTRDLFSDQEYDKSVKTGTNTPTRVRYRVRKTLEALRSRR